ncbi:MAG: hypothetical protein INF88_12375 [Roseomonas sp.]|nr:hypothetical protein [Roseomonas sp.]
MEMPKPLLPNRRLVVGMVGATILGGAGMAMAWPWRRGLPDPTDPRTTLQAVEDAIARLLPEPEMTTAALAARLAAGERIMFTRSTVSIDEERGMTEKPHLFLDAGALRRPNYLPELRKRSSSLSLTRLP